MNNYTVNPFRYHRLKGWTIKRYVGGKHGDPRKTVFPEKSFATLKEAQIFLWEQGLRDHHPTRRNPLPAWMLGPRPARFPKLSK